jgi:CubicO group peptidase (beta-lactamase class C family)
MTVKQGLDFHPHSRTSRWPPGTRHAYCNSGPPVAAYIVEKVTGERFEDYVARTFFTPIGMPSTSYFRTKRYEEHGATLYQGASPQEYWRILHRPSGSINSSARRGQDLVVSRGSAVPAVVHARESLR